MIVPIGPWGFSEVLTRTQKTEEERAESFLKPDIGAMAGEILDTVESMQIYKAIIAGRDCRKSKNRRRMITGLP